jgi:uncharacterized protein
MVPGGIVGAPRMEKTKKSETGEGKVRNAGPDPAALAAAARAGGAGGRKLPPVHLWNPPHCGAIDMRIARDGTWFHEGTPIGRIGLVRLFASILRKDEDEYVLVTPVEKVSLVVEDAPFVAVDVEAVEEGLRFTTNLGDEVVAGPDAPIRVERGADGEPRPYVLLRDRLEALIDRKTFYRLVELGEVEMHDGEEWFGVRSGGAFFPIHPAADLDGLAAGA